MAQTALVVGATGIVGSATASLLSEQGWIVHGLARNPVRQSGVLGIAADLQDAAATPASLADLRADAVFITTWLRQNSEGASASPRIKRRTTPSPPYSNSLELTI